MGGGVRQWVRATAEFFKLFEHVIDEVKKMELTDYYRRRNLRHDFRFERTFCNEFESMCVSEI